MAQIPIEILDLAGRHSSALGVAVEEALRTQHEFRYEVLSLNCTDALRLHVLSDTHAGTFFDAVMDQRTTWRGYHPYIVSVIDKLLHSDEWGNLFSSRRSKEGLAVFTTANVADVLIPEDKIVAYFVYEIAVHTLSFIASGRRHHRETRGCIFDFKEDKTGIIQSMKAGALCDPCKRWFAEHATRLSPSQLRAVLALLARSAELVVSTPTTCKARKPRVFVGSSIEGLEVAQALQSGLEHDFSVEIWNQNVVFSLGTATIEALEAAVKEYDFALFVFTADDLIRKRNREAYAPRDNVIFEAGLFIGRITRLRAFIVRPRDVDIQIPSDLNSVTMATYDPNNPSIDAALGPACRKIRIAVRNWQTTQSSGGASGIASGHRSP